MNDECDQDCDNCSAVCDERDKAVAEDIKSEVAAVPGPMHSNVPPMLPEDGE